MEATLAKLKKALKACAKAHNAEFEDWSDEGQLGIWSVTPGTICDVRMICEAFFGKVSGEADSPVEVDEEIGCITIWLSYDFLKEVNQEMMYMALPYGTKI